MGTITLDLDPGASLSGFRQPLAGFELWSSRPIGAANETSARPEAPAFEPELDWRQVYEGPSSELERAPRLVVSRGTHGQRRVEFEDGDSFLVAADGAAVVRLRAAMPPASDATVEERALGAPLALALALRGRFLLHASALVKGDRAVALTAPSGVGKSTIAAFASHSAAGGWRRIADDILPVDLGAEPLALPHFPQLKLPADERYPGLGAKTIPLAALVELDRRVGAGEQAATVALEQLAPAPAILALARATVAARLFDGELLERHLVACARAAGSLRVVRLSYPSGLDRLHAALGLLAELV